MKDRYITIYIFKKKKNSACIEQAVYKLYSCYVTVVTDPMETEVPKGQG